MGKKYSNIHQDIINECKKGSREAQFEVYRLYYKAMFNTSLRIINNTQEAEDVMQDAFLSAFDNIQNYKEEVSFGAWLKRIVVNKSIDYLRKRKIDFENIDDVGNTLFEVENNGKNHETEQGELLQKIRQAIMKLDDGYRVVLSLYLLEGYDHDEISQILDINPSTSRSQFSRAKKKLQALLAESVSLDND